MKEQGPLSLAQLAGAGTGLIGTIFVGLVLGFVVARYAHWEWGLPVGIVAGFIAGMISMYRRISTMM